MLRLLGAICIAILFAVAARAIVEGSHANGYRWPGHAPSEIQLLLVDEMTPEWAPTIQAAADNWNASSVIQITHLSGDCSVLAEHICIRPFYDPACLPVGTTFYDQKQGKRLIHVNVGVNTCVPANQGGGIVCHEIGHALGLEHYTTYPPPPEGVGSCMGENVLTPNAHDFEELASIYD